MTKRVVITGTGVISSVGNDVETLWANLLAGKSGITKIEDEAYAGINTLIAGKITNFEPEKYMDKKDINRFDLFIQYGYAASMQAVEQANIDMNTIDKDRVGVFLGSGMGGIDTTLSNYDSFLDKGPRRVSPFMIPMMIPNMASGIVSIETGFRGPSYSPASACATGNQAIGEAYINIKHGYADAIVAGGTEAPINPLSFAAFSKMRAMSTYNDEPEKASRPFDEERDGFVMAEGAGVLFLEEYEHAKARGAKILGEIVGFGRTTDAHHITSPDYNGAVKAMQLAVDMADIDPSKVDYINAHGTSTPEGDKSETKAIKEMFKGHAEDLLISSTKSMTGHLFGAAGGLEAIVSLMTTIKDQVPPTINLENPDKECDLNYVPNKSVSKEVNYALSNGFGFGGHNAVLLFKKFVD